ncbi:hypothetical protein ACN6K4_003446 [Streptomyces hayashii]|uniref:hypothetical protein n=1 Tax=Streptomyces hayashii TaxID=2839966 RepID=UPI00403C17CD
MRHTTTRDCGADEPVIGSVGHSVQARLRSTELIVDAYGMPDSMLRHGTDDPPSASTDPPSPQAPLFSWEFRGSSRGHRPRPVRQPIPHVPYRTRAKVQGLVDIAIAVAGEATGQISLHVQFLLDVDIACPACDGTRYTPQAHDILPSLLVLTVRQALSHTEDLRRVHTCLTALNDLDLGLGLGMMPVFVRSRGEGC